MNVQEKFNLCQEFRFYKNLDGSSPKNLVTQKKKDIKIAFLSYHLAKYRAK